jgi:hypothetical protein
MYCNIKLILDTSAELKKWGDPSHDSKIAGLKLRLLALFALAIIFFVMTLSALFLGWLIYHVIILPLTTSP